MHLPLHSLLARELAADRVRNRAAEPRPADTPDDPSRQRAPRPLVAHTFAIPVVREIPSAREETRNRHRWA